MRTILAGAASLMLAIPMLAPLILATSPAAAQQYSDSYNFLKAVKDRDGTKATQYADVPGTTVLDSRDPSNGEGALHILVRGRDLTWLSFLLGKGARPDLQNNQGETPLSLAAQIGWIDGAQLLLDNRASVDLANQRGETPLILAARNRDVPMVRLLLAHRADPHKADRVAGYSAIDYAKQDPRAAPVLRVLDPTGKP